MKDICAVSTPLAEGGISVIRISGDNAISIGAKVFKPQMRSSFVISDFSVFSQALQELSLSFFQG